VPIAEAEPTGEDQIRVPFQKDQVKNAPKVEADAEQPSGEPGVVSVRLRRVVIVAAPPPASSHIERFRAKHPGSTVGLDPKDRKMSTSATRANGSATRLPAAPPPLPRAPSPEGDITRFLGWFSLGLGVPQTMAPGTVNRLIGVSDDSRSRVWQRLVGVRELAAAAGIFSRPRPAGWLWARVAGDIEDLALLGAAWRRKEQRPGRLAAATASVAGITAVDAFTAARMSRVPKGVTKDPSVRVRTSTTVRRSPDELYAFWHDFANLPRFMAHLEAVEPMPDGRSHWRATGPAGMTVEWDAEVVSDRPGELIAWRTLPGAEVVHTGIVGFTPAPGDRGTEVHVDIEYAPPAGRPGSIIGKLFGEEPELQVRDDLRRFKQVMETGEVVRSDGTPEGTLARRLAAQRPAQPLERSGS
jgi:uncharacterized membrane protein